MARKKKRLLKRRRGQSPAAKTLRATRSASSKLSKRQLATKRRALQRQKRVKPTRARRKPLKRKKAKKVSKKVKLKRKKKTIKAAFREPLAVPKKTKLGETAKREGYFEPSKLETPTEVRYLVRREAISARTGKAIERFGSKTKVAFRYTYSDGTTSPGKLRFEYKSRAQIRLFKARRVGVPREYIEAKSVLVHQAEAEFSANTAYETVRDLLHTLLKGFRPNAKKTYEVIFNWRIFAGKNKARELDWPQSFKFKVRYPKVLAGMKYWPHYDFILKKIAFENLGPKVSGLIVVEDTAGHTTGYEIRNPAAFRIAKRLFLFPAFMGRDPAWKSPAGRNQIAAAPFKYYVEKNILESGHQYGYAISGKPYQQPGGAKYRQVKHSIIALFIYEVPHGKTVRRRKGKLPLRGHARKNKPKARRRA